MGNKSNRNKQPLNLLHIPIYAVITNTFLLLTHSNLRLHPSETTFSWEEVAATRSKTKSRCISLRQRTKRYLRKRCTRNRQTKSARTFSTQAPEGSISWLHVSPHRSYFIRLIYRAMGKAYINNSNYHYLQEIGKIVGVRG